MHHTNHSTSLKAHTPHGSLQQHNSLVSMLHRIRRHLSWPTHLHRSQLTLSSSNSSIQACIMHTARTQLQAVLTCLPNQQYIPTSSKVPPCRLLLLLLLSMHKQLQAHLVPLLAAVSLTTN